MTVNSPESEKKIRRVVVEVGGKKVPVLKVRLERNGGVVSNVYVQGNERMPGLPLEQSLAAGINALRTSFGSELILVLELEGCDVLDLSGHLRPKDNGS